MPTPQNATQEDHAAVHMALGRLFRIMSRPYQPGDDQEFETCRSVIMNLNEGVQAPYAPNYARDRNSGAAGQ